MSEKIYYSSPTQNPPVYTRGADGEYGYQWIVELPNIKKQICFLYKTKQLSLLESQNEFAAYAKNVYPL